MSKLSKETAEKAEKFLAKKGEFVDESLRKEIATALERSLKLADEHKRLKEAVVEKGLDLDESARALDLAIRKGKRAAETALEAAKRKAAAEKKAAAAAAAAAEKAAAKRSQGPKAEPKKPAPQQGK